MSKVRHLWSQYGINLKIRFRCTALPDKLDAEGSRRRTRAMTDLYVATLDAASLWRDFGIRSDVTVQKSLNSALTLHLTAIFDSPLQMNFLVQIFTSCSPPTSFIKFTRGHSKIISSPGLMTIFTLPGATRRPRQLLMILIEGLSFTCFPDDSIAHLTSESQLCHRFLGYDASLLAGTLNSGPGMTRKH